MTDKDLRKLGKVDLIQLLLTEVQKTAALKEQVAQLEAEVKKLTSTNDHLKERLNDKDETMAGLKEKLNDKDERFAGLKDKLDDKDAQIEHLKRRLDSKDEKIDEYKNLLENKSEV